MITLNKEILMHPDFVNNIADELCDYLEALMDAEFEKGDECDFDFIDECADAINEIRSGSKDILPVISRKEFFRKITGKNSEEYKAVIAVCAVIALLFGIASFSKTESESFIKEISAYISSLLSGENTTVNVTALQETTQPTTKAEKTVIGIEVETTPEFKTEYAVGESFYPGGIKVYALYSGGAKEKIGGIDFSVETSPDFATEAKYENVTVKAFGFEKTLEVRVIETLETPKLTSVYAVFSENFDFTSKDLNNIDLSAMEVYAVYSNNTERKLSANEYQVAFEDESTFFKKEVFVTVSYEGCSCSFVMTEGGN